MIMTIMVTKMVPPSPLVLLLLLQASTCNSAAPLLLVFCSISEFLKPPRKPSEFEEAWLTILL